MRMTCILVGSWNEEVLISTKCQERAVEKSKEEKNSRGSKFYLVAFLPLAIKSIVVF